MNCDVKNKRTTGQGVARLFGRKIVHRTMQKEKN